MMKINSYFVSLILAGSVVGCAAQNPTDQPPGDDDGSDTGGDMGSGDGSNAPQGPTCGDHTCSGSETSASCPADCPANAVCGDGQCNGTESANSCAQDCTVCGDGTCGTTENVASCAADCAAPPSTCTTAPDNCTGNTVCVAGSCVAAYGRVYKLFIADATLPERNADNETWDYNGGLPDAYVYTFLNSSEVFYTSYKDNTLQPVWDESATVSVAAGAKLQLDIYNSEYGPDQYMFSCFGMSVTPDMLRKHGGSYMASCIPVGGSIVRFYFQPQ